MLPSPIFIYLCALRGGGEGERNQVQLCGQFHCMHVSWGPAVSSAGLGTTGLLQEERSRMVALWSNIHVFFTQHGPQTQASYLVWSSIE